MEPAMQALTSASGTMTIQSNTALLSMDTFAKVPSLPAKFLLVYL